MAFGKFTDLLGETMKTMLVKDDSKVQFNSSKFRNLIGFTGVTEGIGTSAFIAHLALELQSPSTPVLIVDLNYALPSMYSWFFTKDFDISMSITQLFNTNAADKLSEFTFRNSDNGVSVVTPHTLKEIPDNWCQIDQQSVHEVLSVARTHYAYVLVDLGSNLANNATFWGLLECNQIYTLVTPNEGHKSMLRSKRNYFIDYNKAGVMSDIIESMTLGDATSADEWASIKYNLIGTLPFDTDISTCIRNFTPLSSVHLRSANVNAYNKVIKVLANQIKDYCAIEKDFVAATPDDEVTMGKKIVDDKDW